MDEKPDLGETVAKAIGPMAVELREKEAGTGGGSQEMDKGKSRLHGTEDAR